MLSRSDKTIADSPTPVLMIQGKTHLLAVQPKRKRKKRKYTDVNTSDDPLVEGRALVGVRQRSIGRDTDIQCDSQ